MLPYSDVDIMICLKMKSVKKMKTHLYIYFLFMGCRNFKPGISVRTIQSCVEQAATDLTVATTLVKRV